MKFFILVMSFLVLAKDEPLKKIDIQFKNGKKLEVEVAQSFSERYQGLMHRQSLQKNAGMLFVFDRPQKLSFWMKNTYIPLSIAYIDEDKTIKEIYEMKAQSLLERTQHTEDYPSQCNCLYALEVNQGWFKENKIKVGDVLRFDLPPQ